MMTAPLAASVVIVRQYRYRALAQRTNNRLPKIVGAYGVPVRADVYVAASSPNRRRANRDPNAMTKTVRLARMRSVFR